MTLPSDPYGKFDGPKLSEHSATQPDDESSPSSLHSSNGNGYSDHSSSSSSSRSAFDSLVLDPPSTGGLDITSYYFTSNSSGILQLSPPPAPHSNSTANGNGDGGAHAEAANSAWNGKGSAEGISSPTMNGSSAAASNGTAAGVVAFEEKRSPSATPAAPASEDLELLLQQATGESGSMLLTRVVRRDAGNSEAAAAALLPQQDQQQPAGSDAYDDASWASTSGGGGASSLDDTWQASRSLQRVRYNYRGDDRFEMAISRWAKEAQDWVTIRKLLERWGPRLNPTHLSVMTCRLAKLYAPKGVPQPMYEREESGFKAMLDTIAGLARRMAPAFDARAVTGLLWGLSQLQHRNVNMLDALLLHTQRQLGSSDITPRQLGLIVLSLSRLDHRPTEGWMQEFFAQSERHLGDCDPGNLTTLLQGLAHMQPQRLPPRPWLAAFWDSSKEKLPSFGRADTTTLMRSIGRLGVRPPLHWCDEALSHIQSQFDMLDPMAFASILSGLANIEFSPTRAWMIGFFRASYPQLPGFKVGEMVNVLYALARLRSYPADEWLDEVFELTEARMRLFPLHVLAQLGWVLAKLSLRPPKSWLRAYCVQLLKCDFGAGAGRGSGPPRPRRTLSGNYYGRVVTGSSSREGRGPDGASRPGARRTDASTFQPSIQRRWRALRQVIFALETFQVGSLDKWRRELYRRAAVRPAERAKKYRRRLMFKRLALVQALRQQQQQQQQQEESRIAGPIEETAAENDTLPASAPRGAESLASAAAEPSSNGHPDPELVEPLSLMYRGFVATRLTRPLPSGRALSDSDEDDSDTKPREVPPTLPLPP